MILTKIQIFIIKYHIIRYKMTGLSFRQNQMIDRWESQDEDQNPVSHNMLRVLQSKIINSVKFNDNNKPKKAMRNIKLPINQRPATVRVRPNSSNKMEGLQSFPTIDIYSERQATDRLKNQNKVHKLVSQQEYDNEGFKFKSQHLTDLNINLLKVRQNLNEKDFFSLGDKWKDNRIKLRQKCQKLQMKKQALVFNHNSNSVKDKKSLININNFHEMEIKLRKQRIKSNNSTKANKHKMHIFIEFNEKTNQVRANIKKSSKGKQNNHRVGLDKFNQTHYTKILNRNGRGNKQEINQKRQQHIFTDDHLAQASINAKAIY